MRYTAPGVIAVSLALTLQFAASPAIAATILHLSSSATVKVMPDQLTATLAAEANAVTPVEAQAAVNTVMSKALALVRSIGSVTVSTGSYSVWHVTDPQSEWRAAQTMNLDASDGRILLGLVETLQSSGLTVSSLAWNLRQQTAEKAQDKAEAMAIAALKGKAERAAKLLGMHFAGFRIIWLTPLEGPPPGPIAMMAARAIREPNAVAGETSVTATVTAEVRLDSQ